MNNDLVICAHCLGVHHKDASCPNEDQDIKRVELERRVSDIEAKEVFVESIHNSLNAVLRKLPKIENRIDKIEKKLSNPEYWDALIVGLIDKSDRLNAFDVFVKESKKWQEELGRNFKSFVGKNKKTRDEQQADSIWNKQFKEGREAAEEMSQERIEELHKYVDEAFEVKKEPLCNHTWIDNGVLLQCSRCDEYTENPNDGKESEAPPSYTCDRCHLHKADIDGVCDSCATIIIEAWRKEKENKKTCGTCEHCSKLNHCREHNGLPVYLRREACAEWSARAPPREPIEPSRTGKGCHNCGHDYENNVCCRVCSMDNLEGWIPEKSKEYKDLCECGECLIGLHDSLITRKDYIKKADVVAIFRGIRIKGDKLHYTNAQFREELLKNEKELEK